MQIVPMTLRAANSFVEELHRHHGPSRGHKFSIGAMHKGKLVGVAIVGRPVSRVLDEGFICEVTRLCTDGTKNACSALYGACARVAKEMGYHKIVTYTLVSEPGTSLKAVGWKLDGKVKGRSWSCPSRPRGAKYLIVDKNRWVRDFTNAKAKN